LPRELKARIKGFVLGYGRQGGNAVKERQVLANISGGLAPFWDSSNRQLVPIREIMYAKKINKIRNDQHLSAEQKKSEIAALEDELSKVKDFGAYLEKY
jgi:phosphonate transport system substrate-binding protein